MDWTAKKWIAVTAAVFIVQLAFVALLSAKREGKFHRSLAGAPGVCLLTTVPNADAYLEMLVMRDPANSALVNSNGFSGRLWFGSADVGRGWPTITDPHHWLQVEQINALLDNNRPQPQAAPTPTQIATERPALVNNATPPTAPLLTNSILRLEGNLQRRKILNPPTLQTWEFTDVLLPSSVQILLDEYGHVINAILLSQSGLAAADEKALELARNLTFAQPDTSPATMEWGIVTFVWVTREPSTSPAPTSLSTNSPPPTS